MTQTREGSQSTHAAPGEPLDIREMGAPKNGAPQLSDKRLYVQLQVFTNCLDLNSITNQLQSFSIDSVLYADVNDPKGVGILFLTENPAHFVQEIRSLLNSSAFSTLKHRPEMTMFGKSYALGRETDLEDWLLKKPRRNALNPAWPWAVWYPLRRKSEFELLTKEEQSKILYEHAKIGINYGLHDFAHDIRLSCYGLDQNDNEFVLGLIGPELHPLSRVVQDMRKTQQTAKYIQSLGPFFIGKAVWQSPLK